MTNKGGLVQRGVFGLLLAAAAARRTLLDGSAPVAEQKCEDGIMDTSVVHSRLGAVLLVGLWIVTAGALCAQGIRTVTVSGDGARPSRVLLRSWSGNSYPGVFELAQTGDIFHVVRVMSRNAQGKLERQQPLLDAPV
jgi:hypothetical protein